MKLFVHLAIIAAFASPIFAQANESAVSEPTHKVVADKHEKKGKKGKKKKGDAAAMPADSAAPAAAPAGEPASK